MGAPGAVYPLRRLQSIITLGSAYNDTAVVVGS